MSADNDYLLFCLFMFKEKKETNIATSESRTILPISLNQVFMMYFSPLHEIVFLFIPSYEFSIGTSSIDNLWLITKFFQSRFIDIIIMINFLHANDVWHQFFYLSKHSCCSIMNILKNFKIPTFVMPNTRSFSISISQYIIAHYLHFKLVGLTFLNIL